MRLRQILPAIAVVAAGALGPVAQAQPQLRKEAVEAFLAAFRHFLAVTSAGVDECGSRFPERRDGYVAALEGVRFANLDVIVHAELGAEFPELLRVEKAQAAAETREVMAEYCEELPRFVGVVGEYAARLRSALANP